MNDPYRLIQSIRDNNIDFTRMLLRSGIDPNFQDVDGNTGLIISSMNDNFAIVNTLLSNGADPNIKNLGGNTALMLASAEGNIEIVRVLLQRNADPDIQNVLRETALMMAIVGGPAVFRDEEENLECAKLLIQHNANPNLQDQYGMTALMYALINDYNEIVVLLLDHGADITIEDADEGTVLDYTDDPSTIVLLESYRRLGLQRRLRSRRDEADVFDSPSPPDINQLRYEAARTIQRRARGRRTRRKLTKKRPKYGKMAKPTTDREKMRRWTDLTRMYDDDPIRGYEQFIIYPKRLLPGQTEQIGGGIFDNDLIDAAQNNDIDLVRQLLDNGIDINVRDDTGNTTLARASLNGHIEIVKLLLDRGADINSIDENGWTSLMLASSNRYTEIVKLLLEKGADPNIQDQDGNTALIDASHIGDIENVELLLEKGADYNIPDIDGMTALMIALDEGHTGIVDLLKRHINATKIQSRVRGKQTRRKARTQRAYQQKSAAQVPFDYEASGRIGSYLSRMPYNPEVARRTLLQGIRGPTGPGIQRPMNSETQFRSIRNEQDDEYAIALATDLATAMASRASRATALADPFNIDEMRRVRLRRFESDTAKQFGGYRRKNKTYRRKRRHRYY